jgi:outer membrane murein-binding lipoprotein Lpp
MLLIIYQIFLAHSHFVEGMDNGTGTGTGNYQNYDTNNPNNAMILAQQNAGNISYLKGQVDQLSGIGKEVQDLSLNVAQLNSQVQQIVMQQTKTASNLVGDTPPKISGT